MNELLKSPFPFYGGKQHYASIVWDQFGPVTRYIEPFAGSLAVFLRCPYMDAMKGASVVCDKNPWIANFWRALKGKGPDDEESASAVAWWADYPTIHQDLRARHKWLLEWAEANRQRLWDDATYFDCQAAGWWVWGMSNWVGAGFCTGDIASDRVPHLQDTPSGKGVSMQRLTLVDGEPRDNRPFIQGHPGGLGVSAQRLDLEPPDTRPFVQSHPAGQGIQMQNVSLHDKRPFVDKSPSGMGVSMQRLELSEANGLPLDGSRLQPWMLELCHRLKRTVILHRDWKSAVSPKMLMREKNASWTVGVFLDPPYRTDEGNRNTNLYQSDHDGESDDAAKEAYEWAVKHGETERYRIAFCCRHGDFPLPPNWTSSIREFPGVTDPERREKHKDEIMFSPHCGQGRRLL